MTERQQDQAIADNLRDLYVMRANGLRGVRLVGDGSQRLLAANPFFGTHFDNESFGVCTVDCAHPFECERI